jgi:hypothetical protein
MSGDEQCLLTGVKLTQCRRRTTSANDRWWSNTQPYFRRYPFGPARTGVGILAASDLVIVEGRDFSRGERSWWITERCRAT